MPGSAPGYRSTSGRHRHHVGVWVLWLVVGLTGWRVLASVAAVLIGRSIRLADGRQLWTGGQSAAVPLAAAGVSHVATPVAVLVGVTPRPPLPLDRVLRRVADAQSTGVWRQRLYGGRRPMVGSPHIGSVMPPEIDAIPQRKPAGQC